MSPVVKFRVSLSKIYLCAVASTHPFLPGVPTWRPDPYQLLFRRFLLLFPEAKFVLCLKIAAAQLFNITQ